MCCSKFVHAVYSTLLGIIVNYDNRLVIIVIHCCIIVMLVDCLYILWKYDAKVIYVEAKVVDPVSDSVTLHFTWDISLAVASCSHTCSILFQQLLFKRQVGEKLSSMMMFSSMYLSSTRRFQLFIRCLFLDSAV